MSATTKVAKAGIAAVLLRQWAEDHAILAKAHQSQAHAVAARVLHQAAAQQEDIAEGRR